MQRRRKAQQDSWSQGGPPESPSTDLINLSKKRSAGVAFAAKPSRGASTRGSTTANLKHYLEPEARSQPTNSPDDARPRL